ncbi:MAG: ADP-ribosylation factor-like protein, partial [Candidatus Hodarchaeota archaeon]
KIVDEITANPTKGVNRDKMQILGQEIVVHDLGGQKKYRIQYLENADYFDSTDVFLYVVDLQDKKRYDLALEYYTAALDMFGTLKVNPKIFIFFHKFDGDYLLDYKDITTRLRVDQDQYISRYKESSKDFDVLDVFNTSIYDEWGLYTAFNTVWSSIISPVEKLQAFLETLVSENEEIGIALLLDQSGNIMARKIQEQEKIDLEDLVNMAARSILVLLDWQRSLDDETTDYSSDFAIMEMDEQTIMLQKIDTKIGIIYLVLYAAGGDYKEIQVRLARISEALEKFL